MPQVFVDLPNETSQVTLPTHRRKKTFTGTRPAYRSWPQKRTDLRRLQVCASLVVVQLLLLLLLDRNIFLLLYHLRRCLAASASSSSLSSPSPLPLPIHTF